MTPVVTLDFIVHLMFETVILFYFSLGLKNQSLMYEDIRLLDIQTLSTFRVAAKFQFRHSLIFPYVNAKKMFLSEFILKTFNENSHTDF